MRRNFGDFGSVSATDRLDLVLAVPSDEELSMCCVDLAQCRSGADNLDHLRAEGQGRRISPPPLEAINVRSRASGT
jgi:hypothetical protein